MAGLRPPGLLSRVPGRHWPPPHAGAAPTRYLSLATGAFWGAGAYLTALVGPRMPWAVPVLLGGVAGASMALLGGVGSVAGPVVGAVFLGLASELLLLKFRYAYMLGLGLTLIVVVLALPSGLTGLWTHRPRWSQGNEPRA